jgi:hypothetical protein
MFCPHCHTSLSSAIARCEACGFSLEVANGHYGDYSVELEPILAFEEFPEADKQQLEVLLGEWRDAFPQLFLSIYLGPEPEGPSLTTFAFWLINRGQATVQGSVWNNQNTLLLIVEPFKKEAVVALGYAVEHWLGAEATQACLAVAQPAFAAGQWREGLEKFIWEVSSELATRGNL